MLAKPSSSATVSTNMAYIPIRLRLRASLGHIQQLLFDLFDHRLKCAVTTKLLGRILCKKNTLFARTLAPLPLTNQIQKWQIQVLTSQIGGYEINEINVPVIYKHLELRRVYGYLGHSRCYVYS